MPLLTSVHGMLASAGWGGNKGRSRNSRAKAAMRSMASSSTVVQCLFFSIPNSRVEEISSSSLNASGTSSLSAPLMLLS